MSRTRDCLCPASKGTRGRLLSLPLSLLPAGTGSPSSPSTEQGSEAVPTLSLKVKVAMGAIPVLAVQEECSCPQPSLCSPRSTSGVTVPVPSGVDLTKVGSIFTKAVGLVSAPSPFSISFSKRWDTSSRVSSESRMWYRYLSTWKVEIKPKGQAEGWGHGHRPHNTLRAPFSPSLLGLTQGAGAGSDPSQRAGHGSVAGIAHPRHHTSLLLQLSPRCSPNATLHPLPRLCQLGNADPQVAPDAPKHLPAQSPTDTQTGCYRSRNSNSRVSQEVSSGGFPGAKPFPIHDISVP